MKIPSNKFVESRFKKSALWTATVVGLGLAHPGLAETSAAPDTQNAQILEEILVSARRRAENIQDVPISIKVFDQTALDNSNVANSSDLALITPGLTVNTRFGDDSTSFAIRGFTQELRTTASVGVYFADVVAPRGSGAVTSGDGAGPGSLFDLENVQVLKGPQGTLFGRNTTGGAVLIVPKKPTDQLEGYIEGSVGNYAMRRAQGVINIPLTDSSRLRLGVDTQQRDGYLDNVSGIGPDTLSDLDYVSARASLVIDITPSLENYTIFTYADSENNGSVSQPFACNTASGSPLVAVYGPACAAQLANSSDDYWEIENGIPNPSSEIEQWQVINTTTWEINEELTLKNILSFANLETTLVSGIYGFNLQVPTFTGNTPTGESPIWFANSGVIPGVPTTDQESFVEELQLQGKSSDEKLVWQMGIYYETSEPGGDAAGQSFAHSNCDLSTLGTDPAAFRCNDYLTASVFGNGSNPPFRFGGVNRNYGGIEYENKAVYTQATYQLMDSLSVTGGLRYTWDETIGTSRSVLYLFDGSTATGAPLGAPIGETCADPGASLPDCTVRLKESSEAPTWLLGIDYTPADNTLLYAKYARGYRQGSVNIAGINGLNTHEPEEVDSYEIGSKTTFSGNVPGIFNASIFYNDLNDQQIQLGLLPRSGAGTTAIVNAGKSTIWGVEIETGAELFEGFMLSASYTYLNTEVKELDIPVEGTDYPAGLLIAPPSLTAAEGEPLSFSPEHQAAITAAYTLPVDAALGNIVVAATYIYTDDQQAVAKDVSPFATIPSYEVLNLNLNWTGIGASPVDAAIFVTNAMEEEYYTFVPGQYDSTGFETRSLGMPRMFGLRVKYNFES